jgi:16S rRNA (guanine966-N2)-methyltransferase
VIFVDNSRRAIKVIENSAKMLDAKGAITQRGDAVEYIRDARRASFDIVFLDPPFADERLEELCRLIDELRLLAPGGRVYLEQDRAKPVATLPGNWHILKDRTAGNVRFRLAEVASKGE